MACHWWASSSGAARHDDQVYLVAHQAIAPDVELRRQAILRQQPQVQQAILIARKHIRLAVPAMGDMMGEVNCYNSSESGHGLSEPETRISCNTKSILSPIYRFIERQSRRQNRLKVCREYRRVWISRRIIRQTRNHLACQLQNVILTPWESSHFA